MHVLKIVNDVPIEPCIPLEYYDEIDNNWTECDLFPGENIPRV
jgi:hypothetical protein